MFQATVGDSFVADLGELSDNEFDILVSIHFMLLKFFIHFSFGVCILGNGYSSIYG